MFQSADVPLQLLRSPLYDRFEVEVSTLRLDQIHPQISGNKWFKLRPALDQAVSLKRPLLSFGGAWSNHIHALAWAGHQAGVETVGVIRGEPASASNAMLTDARRWGMQLEFVDRQTYRLRECHRFQQQLSRAHRNALVVPEGGSTAAAVHSVAHIWQLPVLRNRRVDLLLTAVGSGGTLAGLVAGKPACTQVLGVPVLRAGDELKRKVVTLLETAGYGAISGWGMLDGAHRGGYARLDAELAAMMRRVEYVHALPLDPIYTAKLLMAFHRLLLTGQVMPGSRVVLVHTGGLQGVRGQAQKLSLLAPAFQGPLAV